jgi:hypothetical protein
MIEVCIHRLFAGNHSVHPRMNIALDKQADVDIAGRTALGKAF